MVVGCLVCLSESVVIVLPTPLVPVSSNVWLHLARLFNLNCYYFDLYEIFKQCLSILGCQQALSPLRTYWASRTHRFQSNQKSAFVIVQYATMEYALNHGSVIATY